MYSRQTIIDMCSGFTEDRATKLDLAAWLDFEIQQLVNKKRWWWRKKSFTQSLTTGTQTYNLQRSSLGGDGWADDLDQLISLWVNNSDGSETEIIYTTLQQNVAAFLANTDSGQPAQYTFKPGTTKTILFDTKPDSTYSITGIYWASYNPVGPQASQTIPLIPEDYHYVLVLLLMKRLFFYLYGMKDPRYLAAAEEAKEAVDDLRGYNKPAQGEHTELRDTESRATVRATS